MANSPVFPVSSCVCSDSRKLETSNAVDMLLLDSKVFPIFNLMIIFVVIRCSHS